MTTVFVQKNESGEWLNENTFSAAYGFRMRGYEVLSFTENELRGRAVPLSKETIVAGGIGCVREALRQLGVRSPENFDYPHCLRQDFMDHPPRQTTLQAIHDALASKDFHPVFIKPVEEHKAFTGRVIREFKDLLPTSSLPPEFKVWALSAIKFLSEHRVFILKGDVVGVRHYAGDPLVFPNGDTIKRMVRKAKVMDQAAYSLDVGVAEFPERPEKIRNPTLLVEANDAFSLGSYGLPSHLYVQMIEARWKQMVGV
jgi:hypothetical protein